MFRELLLVFALIWYKKSLSLPKFFFNQRRTNTAKLVHFFSAQILTRYDFGLRQNVQNRATNCMLLLKMDFEIDWFSMKTLFFVRTYQCCDHAVSL